MTPQTLAQNLYTYLIGLGAEAEPAINLAVYTAIRSTHTN